MSVYSWRQVRQKDIRALLADGAAQPLSAAAEKIRTSASRYNDFAPIYKSFGVYGINGLAVLDHRTGAVYADAARTSNVFYFDK